MQLPPVFKNLIPENRWTRHDLFPTTLITLLLLVLLQLWIPYFFLASDNLTQFFPVWTEWGRHLLQGESPLKSHYLLGGNYPLYKDPSYLSCFHPVVSLISLLAETPARFAIIDLFCSLEIFCICLSMAFFLSLLKRRGLVELQRWQITVLSLSYGFSGFNLLVGSLWVTYLSNQIAIPLYFAATLFKNRKTAVLCVAVAGIQAFLASVPSSYLFTLVVCSLALVIKCRLDAKAEPLIRWMAGQALAGVVLSPLLYFSILGFFESSRSGASPYPVTYIFDVPLSTLLGGWFLSSLAGIFARDFTLFYMSVALACTLFGAGASWWLLTCFIPRKKTFTLTHWEWMAWVAVIVCLFLVVRPTWVTTVLSYLPFLRSTRWPFREMLILLFFLHLLMAFRLQYFKKIWLVRLFVPGALVFVISLIAFVPPCLQFNQLDRQLVLSGQAEAYWARIKKQFPDATFVTVFNSSNMIDHPRDVSLVLFGAYNYPAFLGIKSIGGYTTTAPASSLPLKNMIANGRGYFEPYEFDLLEKQFGENITVIRQSSYEPVGIQIQGQGQATESEVFLDEARYPTVRIKTAP